ncbi:ComC/BlpC family leader-containing pheromone/bacteriocin [Lactobacillus delbrueckii subsp. lactis]|uniref:ComC/BlpC family leader-containing pheromone/bacteriocin n=1 Tax=Lactobacillus delbrueckii TaxID=1584 RepID=UPI001E5B5C2F|nr:ComC/BlpC family leader-containing pheromone/bacteriocin [Lactobacillus delbrueckii]MCD5442312.1 ComC/BlpC family leader-containing pheromone/bacteriocin [Lactobacillus delbrueckii subsp. lactis]MCD5494299.1 ComC/BlpC family leader-containing pheromone/bacteriocin [Lactobacillus delbrueckii subsp. lactis]MCD5529152.1 ComC/BlpC family leader-containing pheromone/bacteriocin [Lactobacillus delbrueckii subsp. lactis]MCD5531308.1 ComC/BlpC family leader-containing pheromone/bacteriocin [Lactobac
MDNNLHKVETLTDEELEQIVGGSIEGFLPYVSLYKGIRWGDHLKDFLPIIRKNRHCQFFCVNKSFR